MRQKQRVFSLFLLSPSSRRAWIEIRVTVSVSGSAAVALLAEGVDRNGRHRKGSCPTSGSPSSRRAWIEMVWLPEGAPAALVALLAEGVDRNNIGCLLQVDEPVVLLAEGVDRNIFGRALCIDFSGRPPRGGRG